MRDLKALPYAFRVRFRFSEALITSHTTLQQGITIPPLDIPRSIRSTRYEFSVRHQDQSYIL